MSCGINKLDRIDLFLKDKLGQRAGSLFAPSIKSFYLFLRSLKSFYHKLQLFYEGRTAPFLAVNLWWIYWPFYRFLKSKNICFVVNIGDCTGHIIMELDNFFRKMYLGKIDKNKRYVWIRKSTEMSKACIELYKHKFWWAKANIFLYNFLLPMAMRFKDITLDCGISSLKFQLPDNLRYYKPKFGELYIYLYEISTCATLNLTMEYYKQIAQSRKYFPLLDSKGVNADKKLVQFLNGNKRKIALVHIKTVKSQNATVIPTDPKTYLMTLGYLSDMGYQLVFVGREKFPEEFRHFNVLNYANSNIATFKRDIQIFKMAELAMIGGSGLSLVAEVIDTPYLYLNSWQLPFFMSTPEKSVIVPTLLKKKPGGGYLKFSEQINLFKSMPVLKGMAYNLEKSYEGRNATADEILKGMQELMELKGIYGEHSPFQAKSHKINPNTSNLRCLSGVSENFLLKHVDLF